MRRRIRAPKPSVSPLGYSTLSLLSQPTKKMTGTLPLVFFGRVMKVRSLSPRLLLTSRRRLRRWQSARAEKFAASRRLEEWPRPRKDQRWQFENAQEPPLRNRERALAISDGSGG